MDVGIGLPNAVPGASGDELVEWARRAESAGFSTLGTIDRIVYPNYEPLVALAAAAAVTDRMTLGVAPGGREDDYEAAHEPFSERGARFDEMLGELAGTWDADAVGPKGKPGLLLGGSVDASFRRAAQHGEGWIMGGGTPEMFSDGHAKLEQAWTAAGRDGQPRGMALAYFALGDGGQAAADGYLKDYYAWLGGDYFDQIAASAATDAGTVKGYVQAFEQAGCDELILFPSASDPEQVDLLGRALQ